MTAARPDLDALFAHPDAAAFVRKMAADSSDDLPRLTFADWLEEHGEGERAEFIRVQCRAAEMYRLYDGASPLPDGHPAHAEIAALAARERELLGPAAPGEWRPTAWEWFGRHIPGPLNHPPCTWAVRRGWVAEARAPLAVLFGGPCWHCHWDASRGLDCVACSGTRITPGVAAALGRAHPLVERVVLTDRSPLPDADGSYWFDVARQHGAEIHAPSDLPSGLFTRLAGGDEITPGCRRYAGGNGARAALATAALTELRARAARPEVT